MSAELKLFVYGTLKKGFSNHARYCRGVLRIEQARLTGKLFRLTPEIPILVVPESAIFARGSSDVGADMRLQDEVRPARGHDDVKPGAAWKTIRGELLVFNDSEKRLPSLDRLEEFRPGRPSTYNRVLVRTTLHDDCRCFAWTYIAGIDTDGLEPYEEETWFPDALGNA